MTAPIIENNYVGDGSTVLFSFTFEYIEAVDVEVSIDSVTQPTTAYSLANSTTIEFNTAPAVGAAIRIYRNTTVNDPKATFFPGSAIRAQDLNDNFEQILFVTQEADAISERAEAAADAAQIATTAAQAAASSATAAASQAQTQVNASAASAAAAAADAAQASTDAASAVSTANSAVASANTANTNATAAAANAAAAATSAASAASDAAAAQTSASNAQTSAANALTQSAAAQTAATSAQTSATNAAASAVVATNNSSAAVTTANSANATANTAASDASTALTAANNAVSTANAATSTANTADTNASAAVTTANGAATTATNAANTANAALTAANSAVSTANTADTNASAAVSTANTADSNASTALSTANTAATDASSAVTTANAASATANQASTDAASAVSTANSASTAASNAVSTANTADSNASTALSTANTAQTTANGAVSTANTANTTANNAASLAQTAANAVADSYLFEVVANVAAIPSNPSNNDAVRVSNSTGIESSSVVQNVPSGFTGDSGINVEILYSSTASKWNYVAYNANDPDDRYGYPPYVDVTRQNTVDAATLSGRPLNSTHLGTFTGSTITDNSTIKSALQDLETEVETKADLVGGVVPTSQLPALAITTFLGTVANQTAMLALSGQRGDFAIRSDTSTTFVLTSDGGSNLSDWQELETPTIPIQTVNGQTGTVVLGPSDVGALSTGGGTLTGNVKANDSVKFTAGTSDDLQIYHSSNSHIDNTTGELAIRNFANDYDITLQSDNGSGGIAVYVRCDGSTGAVNLNHYGTTKLITKTDGIDVTGEVQCDFLDVDGGVDIDGGQVFYDATNNLLRWADGARATFGADNDLQIKHDGSNSFITDNGTGNLYIQGRNLVLEDIGGENYLNAFLNGQVELFYDNSKKFETKSDGIDVTGEVQCDSLDVDGAADITGNVTLHANLDLQDNDRLNIGSSDDLSLRHDGSHSTILNTTGALRLAGDLIELRNQAGNEFQLVAVANGATRLYYDGALKLATKSDGVDVTGELQCDSLDVDGPSNFSHKALFTNCATSNHDDMATTNSYLGAFEVYNSGAGNDAFFALHTGSDFACYFGLDADTNDIAVGGWSMGANKYRVWHQNNDGSGSGLDADLVDGLQASSFLRSDTADTATGDITFSGGAGAARIAANSDIRLESGSWTGEVGTGACKIQSHANHIYFQSHSKFIFRNGSANDRLTIDSSGNLVADGNVTAYSDIRLKKDIEVIPNALDKVLSLRGVNYTNIESGDRRTGVIAQEVQHVLPEAVQENEEYLSVAYGNLAGVLIESIKELKAEIDDLKAEIVELKEAR